MRQWVMTLCWFACITFGAVVCVQVDDTPWAMGRTWDQWVAPMVVAAVVVVVAILFMIVAVRSAPAEAPKPAVTQLPVEDPRRPQRIWAGSLGLVCLAFSLGGFGWMLSLFFGGEPGMDGRWGAFGGSAILALGGIAGLLAAVSTLARITRLDLADHRARQGDTSR